MHLHARLAAVCLLPLTFSALGALGSCGDDAATGKPKDSADEVEDTQTIIDVISFDTEATSPTDTSVPDGTTATETSQPDGTTATETTQPDTSEGCNTFGCPCQSNNDCIDELCIESADGQVCTRTCIADCPANFDCLGVQTGGGDPISMCVPRHTRLCRPCHNDAECDDPGDPFPAYCLADPNDTPPGATGSFCGSSCANRDCPEGYRCADAELSGGGTAKQCVPNSNECVCRPTWASLGYATDCKVINAAGICDGTRSCTANGLSPCQGQQAAEEICDNVDNNCDGQTDNINHSVCNITNPNGICQGTYQCQGSSTQCVGQEPLPETCNGIDDNCNNSTDENTCSDNLACTTDVCAGPGQCQNALVNGNCLVNGVCYLNGQANALNVCEICDSAKASASFSQTPNTCVIGGACYQANQVNPTNACQVCLPGTNTTNWSAASNTCQIGGSCYAANQANPLNACEICNPQTSTTSFTQALNTCNIQGQCFAAGVKNPTNECLVCDPNKSASGWSNSPNTVACDDSNACSATSFCDGTGQCKGDTACNDSVACTVDQCNPSTGCSNATIAAGSCRINGACYSDNTANPSNPCERCNPSASQSAWTPQPNSVGCNDGQFCTTDDHCDGAGGCTGASRTCADALSCTADSCNEGGDACVNSLQQGNCLIANTCYANSTTQPNNVCYKCDSNSSTSAWSLNNGASCNDGDGCTSSDTCNGGSCAGTFNRDAFEVNDDVSGPYNLGDYEDSQNWPQRTVTTATISGPNDVDYYRYYVDDTAGGDVEPYVRVSAVDPSLDVELCVWFYCTDDDAVPVNVDCNGADGTATGNVTYAGKPYKGCCRNKAAAGGDESMRFEYSTFSDSEMECDSTDDNFRAVVRVRSTNANYSCANPYTLQIGDD